MPSARKAFAPILDELDRRYSIVGSVTYYRLTCPRCGFLADHPTIAPRAAFRHGCTTRPATYQTIHVYGDGRVSGLDGTPHPDPCNLTCTGGCQLPKITDETGALRIAALHENQTGHAVTITPAKAEPPPPRFKVQCPHCTDWTTQTRTAGKAAYAVDEHIENNPGHLPVVHDTEVAAAAQRQALVDSAMAEMEHRRQEAKAQAVMRQWIADLDGIHSKPGMVIAPTPLAAVQIARVKDEHRRMTAAPQAPRKRRKDRTAKPAGPLPLAERARSELRALVDGYLPRLEDEVREARKAGDVEAADAVLARAKETKAWVETLRKLADTP